MKSIFIVSLLLVPGIASAQTPPKTTGGRFQLIQLSTMRRDQFLLDTQTGKVWSKVCYVNTSNTPGDCDMDAWMLERVEGITGSRDAILNQAVAIEKLKRGQTEGGQ